jgi:hypothetical protein
MRSNVARESEVHTIPRSISRGHVNAGVKPPNGVFPIRTLECAGGLQLRVGPR